MPNIVVDWMNCYGDTEPSSNSPQASLLRPITFELRSLQTMAIVARRKQMRSLIKNEVEGYEKELCSMNKGLVYDAACFRYCCDKAGLQRMWN